MPDHAVSEPFPLFSTPRQTCVQNTDAAILALLSAIRRKDNTKPKHEHEWLRGMECKGGNYEGKIIQMQHFNQLLLPHTRPTRKQTNTVTPSLLNVDTQESRGEKKSIGNVVGKDIDARLSTLPPAAIEKVNTSLPVFLIDEGMRGRGQGEKTKGEQG